MTNDGPDREALRGGKRSEKAEPSVREKILQTAGALFYREGIRAVGVDTVVEKSGVAKTSLYRLFASKDDLVAAFLDARNVQLWGWWDRIGAQHSAAPREHLNALLSGIAKRIGSEGFRGCPFLNFNTEFPDERHPGGTIARANRDEMRRRLTEICRGIGVPQPARLADQLMLLVNGAYVSGAALGAEALRRDMLDAADALVAAALVRRRG